MEQALRRVLVLDDDALLRRTMRRALSGRGVEVAEAGDCEAALSAVAAERYDALVVDVVLDERLVHEILPQLRSARPDVPILAMSGHASAAQSFELRDLGADAFMAKPFDVEVLIATLDTLVRLGPRPNGAPLTLPELAALHEQMVRRALAATDGNVTQAASLLDCTRQDLQYWRKKYGLEE
jgi:two-component system response regulator MprA